MNKSFLKKQGIELNDIWDVETNKIDLFNDVLSRTKSRDLIKTIDGIDKTQKAKLFFASQGIDGKWNMKQNMLSPPYTTRIKDVVKIKI